MSPPVRPPRNFRTTSPGRALHAVAEALGSDHARAEALLRFGAVYVNRERLADDRALAAGDYVRVHAEPRRFPVDHVSWRSRVVHVTPEFVVVDKPPGVPVHATCDNAVENVAHAVSRELGCELHVVQRLDIATQGLFVLARTPAFRLRFNRLLADREVTKRYRALVPRALPPGELVHYMRPDERAPRVVDTEARDGWKRCVLCIDACEPAGDAFAVTLTLHTGRTHQIRCQLAAVRAPILGDGLYGSDRPAPAELGRGEAIALQAFELAFLDERFRLPPPWRAPRSQS